MSPQFMDRIMIAFNTMAISIRLLIRGLHYTYKRISGRSSKIEALSIEITSKCIARCVMCNIWKSFKDTEDIPVSGWLGLLRSPAFSELKELDITGGEPFLKDDLAEFILAIIELKSKSLRKLKSIAITTNGFLTEKILKTINEISADLESSGVELVIVLAMDGIGSTHNRIRNVENGWNLLNDTIKKLIEIRKNNQNLILGLKNTILPYNVNELDLILDYAEKNNLFTITSPCIITENRYANTDREHDLEFSKDDIEKIISFYESPRFKWSFHRDMLIDFLKKGTVKKPCSAGFNYLFIRSNGDVFPCPLINMKFGNFKEKPVEKLIDSKQARVFRKKIMRYDACRGCTEPGLERYALPFEGFYYLSLMLRYGHKKFFELHKHMGLEKYF